MAIKIADRYKAAGYYATVWGKKTGAYRAVFSIYDAANDDWLIETARTVEKIGTTKPDAKKWIAGKVEEFTKRGKTASLASKKGKTNFAAFAERYKEFLKENIKGWKQEFQKVDTLVEFFGNYDLNDIEFDHIEDFKRWFAKQTYTRKDGGQEFDRDISTIHRYLARLRHMLRNGSDRYKTTVPSFGHFIKKSNETPKKQKFTFDELQRMFAACDDLFPRKPENRKRWRLVLIAAYTLGCRVDELYQLKGKHIKAVDVANRVGLFELDMADSHNKIHTKKMPILNWLFDEMKAAGSFDKGEDERLFMWTKAYRRPFEMIKEKAEVNPKGTFHTLRATSITDKKASGQELESIQQESGHKKGSGVTVKHYIHLEDQQIIDAASAFNRELERKRQADDVLDADSLE